MTKDRWLKLMKSMGLASSDDSYDSLCNAYSERHRHYHTVQHINAMLRHFDLTSNLTEYPNEVELAIWFHDAIYKPFSLNNEKGSADWAKEFLIDHGYEENGIDRVYRLIMATLHDGAVEHQDERLIVDIDLTILGTPPDVYDEFERNVRKEYRWVPSFIYRKKRKQLLLKFLAQDSIYHLEYFKIKFEKAARENIKKAINNL